MTRRETLYQKVDNDDENTTLIKKKFKDILKDLATLYKEVIKLITRVKDFQVYKENYYKQLLESKQVT